MVAIWWETLAVYALIYQPTTYNRKQRLISLYFFILWKVCIEKVKNSNHHLLKKCKSYLIAIIIIIIIIIIVIIIIKASETSFQSSQ